MTASQQPAAGGQLGASQCPVRASPVDSRWEDWRRALRPIPGFVDWYRKHKISGALLLAAFVIVKGYVLARGDITTALGIVQYAGVVGWAVAAVLSSLPLLAAAMLAIAFYQLLWPLSGKYLASLDKQLSVVGVAFLISAVLTPWWFVIGAMLLGLFFGGVQWGIYKLHKLKLKGWWKLLADWVVWSVRLAVWAASVCAAIAMLYTAWLPNEVVAFYQGNGRVSGPSPVVAYVLAEDSGGTITLLNSNRRIIIRHLDGNVRSVVPRINDSYQHHAGLTVPARAQKRRCRVWASWSSAGSSLSWA